MLKHLRIFIPIFLIFLSACTSKIQEPLSTENVKEVSSIIESEERAGIGANELKKISIEEVKSSDYNSIYYRSGKEIDYEDIKLEEPIVFILEDKSLKNIEVSEVLLEPMKISADFVGEVTLRNICSQIYLDQIDADIKEIVSKIIPVNTEMLIRQEVEEITINENWIGGLYFYPICYELKYKDETYRILKHTDRISDEATKYLSCDGILELRLREVTK